MLLPGKLEGIGWFAHETLSRMVKEHPEQTFYFIFDRPYDKQFIYSDNVIPIVLSIPARHPVLWYLYFHIAMPILMKRLKPDLFFSPEGYMPPGGKYSKAIVMHDIAYEEFPWSVPKLVLAYYRKFFKANCRKADLVFTVSEFSKEDIVNRYHIDPAKVKVVYNGCNPLYHPTDEANKRTTRQKITGGKPYFIFIGAMYPRKNIPALMRAFDRFKKADIQGYKLILVGSKTFMAKELDELKQQLKYGGDIIFTGRIASVQELNEILSAATALTYVSLFEGFGIPCLEAMQAGTAVIASNTSSLPEVCGEAALYVIPTTEAHISDAMHRLSTDDNLRQNLISQGFNQVQKFSWDKTSQKIWDALKKLA